MPQDAKFAAFMRKQHDTEIALGRFSEPFGNSLLPGMYAMPQHVVERKGKCRIITNHSYGVYSLNSMIPNHERSFKVDNIRSLATLLIALRKWHGKGVPLVLWKSDVSQTYRRLPMHPLWQALQALRTDRQFYIDRNNVFGGAASRRMWTVLYAAVAWIAEQRGIINLKAYIDDSMLIQVRWELVHYEPYSHGFPVRQTRLLLLWDELGISHADPKQLFGEQLPFIGFDTDSVAMTITMPIQARNNICEAIDNFCTIVDRPHGKNRRSVIDFQRLIGHVNWALNVFPLYRPGLTLMYKCIADKSNPTSRCYVTEELVRDLMWIKDGFSKSDGVFLMDAIAWKENNGSALVIHTDASLDGLGFWVASNNVAFHAPIPHEPPTDTIFYFEAFVILCAICWAAKQPLVERLLIYTDNYNCVNIFDSFAAWKAYYPILCEAANLLIEKIIDFRVLHIPGHRNQIADMLSRKQFDLLKTKFGGIPVHPLQPEPPGWLDMSAHMARLKPHERPVWSRECLVVERARLLANNLAPNSRLTYNSALNSYMAFCNAHTFPIEPTPDTFSFYITYMSTFVKPTTVASYLSGIASRLEDVYPNVRDVRKHWLVTRTLQGTMRLYNTPVERKRHLTTEDLLALDEHVDSHPEHDLVLFRAMLFVGFHSLLRADELTLSTRVEARDHRCTMMHTHLLSVPEGYQLLLRAHKADQTFTGNNILIRAADLLVDPVARLNTYLRIRDTAFALCPFLWIREDGTVPTYTWFLTLIQELLSNDLGGSSMRSGGATWLAATGTSHDDIRSAVS